jgi:two-component system, cell cycle sensor histidine kinase and response regulator CckA
VCTKQAAIPTGDYVLLSAQDTGCGIPAKDLPHIFEPFYTTKPVGHGTGLGLSTVYGIIKQNNGFVWAYSEVGFGTVLKVYLPCVRSVRSDPVNRDVGSQVVPHGSELILLVEDEAAIRNASAEFLRLCGYRVLTASNGRDALGVARNNPEIRIIVTDVVMPQMSGGQLVQEVRPLLPHSRALFVSGYPGKTVEEHRVVQEDANFLQKPFSLKQLGHKVREVLDKPLAMRASVGG